MNYEYYSALAFVEEKNKKTFEDTLSQLECFDKFKTPDEVKDFLYNKYGIIGNVNKFTAWRDCFLSTENSDKFLLVKIECQNEMRLFYYNK